MGGGARSVPVLRGNEPQKTGARSTRARTRGQNPLVFYILIFEVGVAQHCNNKAYHMYDVLQHPKTTVLALP